METQQHGRKAPGRSQRTPNSSEPPRALLAARLSSQGRERSTKRPPYRCPRNPVKETDHRPLARDPTSLRTLCVAGCPPRLTNAAHCPLLPLITSSLGPRVSFFLSGLPDPGTWEPGGEEGAWEGPGLPRLFKLIGGG